MCVGVLFLNFANGDSTHSNCSYNLTEMIGSPRVLVQLLLALFTYLQGTKSQAGKLTALAMSR